MFRNVAEFLALTGKDKPTTAEKRLIAATRAGEVCILCDPANPSRPEKASDETRIRAPLLRLLILGGTPDCGLHEKGVTLAGGWIEGELDLRYCTARGQTRLSYCFFTERPSFYNAHLRHLDLDDSAFPGLTAQGAKIDASLYLRRIRSNGIVYLNSTEIGGQVNCIGAHFDGLGDVALNGQGGRVGRDFFLREVSANGTIDLSGAQIGGQVSCKAAVFNGAGALALNAQGMEAGKDLFLSNVRATGSVDVNGARIGGQMDCEGATLDGAKTRVAINAQRLRVEQGLIFRRLATPPIGLISLSAAHASDLVDDPASWPQDANNLILDGFTYDRIDGDNNTSFAARRRWLETGSTLNGDFLPQPYTQLAKVLRQMGHAGEARKVLCEREHRLAQHRLAEERAAYLAARDGGPMEKGDTGWIWLRMTFARLWFWLTRIVTGYGYAPQRAVYLSLAVTCVSMIAYFFFWRMGGMVPSDAIVLTSPAWAEAVAANPRAPALVWAGPAATHYETFYAGLYALDAFLPIVDLGQQATWSATTATWWGWTARVWTWGIQIAGYVISSLGLAAATGVLQRNQPD